METVLLNTNLISFIFKNDTRAKEYSPFLEGNLLAISFMTVAELRHDIPLITHNPTNFQKIDKLVVKSILPAL